MLDQYVGQKDSLAMLLMTLRAQKQTNRPLPHMLFLGQPGRGKSTLAKALASELDCPFVIVHGPSIRDAHGGKEHETIADRIREAAGGILFIDEIHALSRTVAEDIYRAIDEGQITVTEQATETVLQPEYYPALSQADLPPELWDEFALAGPGMYKAMVATEVPSKAVVTKTINVGPVTIIGATTDEAMLPPAFLSRLSALVVRLRAYTAEEMANIAIAHAFGQLGTEITAEAAYEAAVRSRATPRRIKQIVERAAEWTTATGGQQITVKDVLDTCAAMGIDRFGMEAPHREMLGLLASADKGLSRTSLAQRMNLPPKNADLYWGDLMELGFVTIATKHEITDAGRAALNG